MFSGLPVCFFAYLRVAISVLLPSRVIAEISVPEESGNSSDLLCLRIDSTQLSLVLQTVAASCGEGRTLPCSQRANVSPPLINPTSPTLSALLPRPTRWAGAVVAIAMESRAPDQHASGNT